MVLRALFHRTLLRTSIPQTARPTYSLFNPWSKDFSGSWKARALLQSAVYAVGIVAATTLVDSYFFPQLVDKPSRYASRKEMKLAIDELCAAFPGPNDVSTDPDTLRTYGFSENSYHPASPHSVVVRPKSTADVVKIVNISRKYRMPITPYSGATSLEGHTSGFESGSICLDMSGMDQILEIHESDSDLICQSGTRWEDINMTLKEKGIPLFFPLDPGPGATAVLPNGEVIKTRSRARKSAAGFDITKLFIGAEGTLGIVTEGKP
ncbi:hypothetical protein C0989_002147 [Termitomyces sp. Mn162]|nr:hypothetical protein C0989_002147 [Termitomyces sp. Mn162]